MQRIQLIANHLSQASPSVEDSPVLFNYNKNSCVVTLNRPKALNALDIKMIKSLQSEVTKWNQDSSTKVTIFKGNGNVAFCAGGDIKNLYGAKTNTSQLEGYATFFREEYILDYMISNMRPIQVALWDGIVMGGGVGISIHAPIRIATENSVFAMPEAKIGLFTDVAGGYFLSRIRNNLGLFLGLTGTRLKGKELVQIGIADFYVKREKLQTLEQEIIQSTTASTTLGDVRAIIRKYEEPVVDKTYANEEIIMELFGKSSLQEIYDALKTTKNQDFAQKILQTMDTQSPLSMRVIFEQIKRGKDLDLRENLKMDMRVVTRFLVNPDLFEGIRCTIINRNDKPTWIHKSVFDVTKEEVDRFFPPIPRELEI